MKKWKQEVEARNLPGFTTTSNGVITTTSDGLRRKLFKERSSVVANAKVETPSMKGICSEQKAMGIPSPQQNNNRWSWRAPRRPSLRHNSMQ